MVADQKNSEAYEFIEEISEKGLDLSYQIFVLELSSQTQQSGIIDLKGFPVPQTFARSFIQFVEDGLYVFLSDISQILPFGKVFP